MPPHGLGCWHLTFPTALLESGLASRIVVRFVPMRGDLIAVSNPEDGTIFLRIDAPLRHINEAWAREVYSLMAAWGVGPGCSRDAVVLPMGERHGVG